MNLTHERTHEDDSLQFPAPPPSMRFDAIKNGDELAEAAPREQFLGRMVRQIATDVETILFKAKNGEVQPRMKKSNPTAVQWVGELAKLFTLDEDPTIEQKQVVVSQVRKWLDWTLEGLNFIPPSADCDLHYGDARRDLQSARIAIGEEGGPEEQLIIGEASSAAIEFDIDPTTAPENAATGRSFDLDTEEEEEGEEPLSVPAAREEGTETGSQENPLS